MRCVVTDRYVREKNFLLLFFLLLALLYGMSIMSIMVTQTHQSPSQVQLYFENGR